MIHSEHLRNEFLRLGMRKYAEDCLRDQDKYKTIRHALDTKLTTIFPQQLRLFKKILEAPGAEAKANFATTKRAVEYLEARTSDFTHLRAAFLALEAQGAVANV